MGYEVHIVLARLETVTPAYFVLAWVSQVTKPLPGGPANRGI